VCVCVCVDSAPRTAPSPCTPRWMEDEWAHCKSSRLTHKPWVLSFCYPFLYNRCLDLFPVLLKVLHGQPSQFYFLLCLIFNRTGVVDLVALWRKSFYTNPSVTVPDIRARVVSNFNILLFVCRGDLFSDDSESERRYWIGPQGESQPPGWPLQSEVASFWKITVFNFLGGLVLPRSCMTQSL
jgi:hypothetical protein